MFSKWVRDDARDSNPFRLRVRAPRSEQAKTPLAGRNTKAPQRSKTKEKLKRKRDRHGAPETRAAYFFERGRDAPVGRAST